MLDNLKNLEVTQSIKVHIFFHGYLEWFLQNLCNFSKEYLKFHKIKEKEKEEKEKENQISDNDFLSFWINLPVFWACIILGFLAYLCAMSPNFL